MPIPGSGSFPTGAALRGLIAALLKETAGYASVVTSQNTTSTSYTDLATVGPQVVLTSMHDRALLLWSADKFNSSATQGSGCAVAISGATTISADSLGVANEAPGALAGFGHDNMQFAIVTINPGSNTYTMKYRASGGTASFLRRQLYVIAP